MSDSVFRLDPNRVFFTVDRDRQWKKVTAESFLRSTTEDLVNDGPYMYLEPEKLSICNLMKEWLKDSTSTDHVKCCDMCELGLRNLKKTLGPMNKQRKNNAH